MGVNAGLLDGKITAIAASMRLQAGAFPGSPIRGVIGCSVARYDLPNVHLVGYDVVTNRFAAYRAPGGPIGLPWNSAIDEVALALKMNPLALRLKNAAKQRTKVAHGPTYPRIGYVETLDAASAILTTRRSWGRTRVAASRAASVQRGRAVQRTAQRAPWS